MAKKRAKIGDQISFTRKDCTCEGIVEIVRDSSVIVEVSKEFAERLGYDTPKTVVRHSNYSILASSETA
ncbi:hypothetical protein DRW41_08930 [Neobacillus piezotolerans]|uniref:DUF2187 domain-containing protein n=2 Tax=Neobacillus piezotolerans TaxID=2259171 RepID=A0A3D8GTY7_9BACI|nr:hypothetical protein DRW41_08930 [Neobacillus piezotolerans]